MRKDKPIVKILVATHKKYKMPTDEIYLPLHVGAEGKFDENGREVDFGIAKDNTGDNISYKNASFGTQTALYWGWKNVNADYKGLVHYRRHFLRKKVKKGEDVLNCVIDGNTLYPLLKKYKVFVPRKRHYYIESVYKHYSHTMNGGEDQLNITRKIIEEKCPKYLNSFDKCMKAKSAYIFNMMILETSLMDDYCSWLFDIIFELEKRVDISNYNDFDKRYIGRVTERLFNVWLLYKLENNEISKSEICELPYNEQVNWMRKIITLIQSKLFNKKYGKSF